MSENVLITGGAGFIGSHLADTLLKAGHQVTVLDILHPQVHGQMRKIPDYLDDRVRVIQGDIRDKEVLRETLVGKTTVYHFAAYTGVGQSMYQISEYLDVNVGGTAVLMELLSEQKNSIKRLVLASSRAVYGEGVGNCPQCGLVHPAPRPIDQLRDGRWEVVCPNCGRAVQSQPTSEETTAAPYSIYAISKQNQEQVCLLIGETYNIPVVVLRFFNVYGPRQSLSNPYTGVISTFITRMKNDRAIPVYEDGRESRDFVHIQDVVQACELALEQEAAVGKIFNVGSGEALTLLQIAQIVTEKFGGPELIISGQYRAGDIRHCTADLTLARKLLGYNPQITFSAGIDNLLADLRRQHWQDHSHIAEQELVKRGLASDGS
ncbi:MAG: SDR family NAD(P)-dependent oxidoreductase [Chloroflexi bacterium]|nr:SDR family NAD(P)-dependent oxidoreductase [Chloroflexota bacterium]